ncbi:MAG: hypothetical protein U9O86_08650 [Campylobacterota bacterium]|nr:hypothetical protein [Campylobacterota bacterium]
MHTLTLNIKDNAYSNILYFLKNLSTDVEILSDKVTAKKPVNKMTSLRGVFSKYADPSKIHLENNAWEMHVIEKYKKENS